MCAFSPSVYREMRDVSEWVSSDVRKYFIQRKYYVIIIIIIIIII